MCSLSPEPTVRRPPLRCWRGFSRRPGRAPGFLIGGRADRLSGLGPAYGLAPLRDRGGRIRHRVLRQALEIHPLPAPHRRPEQSRVRSCRHLRRSCRDRAAIPPLGANRAARGPPRGQRRRRGAEAGAHTGGLDAGRVVRRSGRLGGRVARRRRKLRRRIRREVAGAGALAASGGAQPSECPRRHRRCAPRRRRAAGGDRGAGQLFRRAAAHAAARRSPRRHGLRRLCPPSHGDPHHRGGAAPARREEPHPRRARTALEHHEARAS